MSDQYADGIANVTYSKILSDPNPINVDLKRRNGQNTELKLSVEGARKIIGALRSAIEQREQYEREQPIFDKLKNGILSGEIAGLDAVAEATGLFRA